MGLGSPNAAHAQQPPTNVTATAASSSRIDLAWTASSSTFVSGYRIYYTNGTLLGEVGPSTLSFSDTGLTAMTQYDYYVTMFNFAGESGPSNTASAVTLDPTPPSTPANLQGTAVSTTEIDLSWNAASDPETGIQDYVVYRDGLEVARTGTNLSYRDSGLTPDTQYQYRVSAVNGDAIEGATSSPVNVRTLPPEPPPPPTSLTATTVSDSEIDLSWTAPSTGDVIGYRVYRNGNPVDNTAGTSYRDSGLQGFTTYTYTVTALDGEGLESEPSQPAQATTLDGTPPTQPQSLSATASGATTIQLSWSPSSDPETGVAVYVIYRGGVEITQTTGTSYLDTGLSPATTYGYRVSAVNGQGLEGQRSAQASATTFDATGPTTPENLTATAVGTDRIDLDWSPSSDPETGIAGYRIYRNGVLVATSSQSSYSDSGLAPATEYVYQVSAVNGQGLESDRSDSVSVTTGDATAPTTPQDLGAVAVGTERIDLSWTASQDPETGVAVYRVFRDGSEIGTTTQTVYQDDGLAPATTYEYNVVAVNGDGLESEASNTASATTLDGTGPSTPTDLSATAAGTDRIDLTWAAAEDPETGIALYRIFRDGALIGTTDQTNYQDTGLSPATTYEYRVSAVNGEGLESGLSEPASATTLDGTGPTAPTDLTAEPVSQTQINLAWTASEDPESGVVSYNVYRDNALVGSVPGTSFADTGLDVGTSYNYSVSAVNGEGIEGDRSDGVTASTFPSEDQIPPAPPTGLRVVQP
jgi:chitodextrinase